MLEAPDGSGFAPGDLVVGVVRRPDPSRARRARRGEFDFCRNGRYTERGIKELHGYGSERWTVESEYAVKLDPALEPVGMLMEPTTIVAKAWDQIERIGGRAYFAPRARAGDRRGADRPARRAARRPARARGARARPQRGRAEAASSSSALGAHYHHSDVATVAKAAPPDIVIEATGAAELVFDAMEHNAAAGVVCLTGVSPRGRNLTIDVGGAQPRPRARERRGVRIRQREPRATTRWRAEALGRADRGWLERMVSRRVPLEDFEQALEKQPDDVKVVLEL